MSVQLLDSASTSDFHAPHDFRVSHRKYSDSLHCFESFKDYITKEEAQKLKPEEYEELEHIYKVFTRQEAIELQYKEQIGRIKYELKRIEQLDAAMVMKEKMMHSLRDNLVTLVHCLAEAKSAKSEIYLNMEKNNNYGVFLGWIKKWKDSKRIVGDQSELPIKAGNQMQFNNIRENKVSSNQKIMKNLYEDISEDDLNREYKLELKVAFEENLRLEEAITSVKEQRNLIIMAIENQKDDELEYEAFIQNKGFILEEKCRRIEQLKQDIASKKEGIKKSSRDKILAYLRSKRQPEGLTERSMSIMNTSVLQEVSSKVSGLIGKVFKKKKRVENENGTMATVGNENDMVVLSPEFLKELNLPENLETSPM